jgi:hypothetical protein
LKQLTHQWLDGLKDVRAYYVAANAWLAAAAKTCQQGEDFSGARRGRDRHLGIGFQERVHSISGWLELVSDCEFSAELLRDTVDKWIAAVQHEDRGRVRGELDRIVAVGLSKSNIAWWHWAKELAG